MHPNWTAQINTCGYFVIFAIINAVIVVMVCVLDAARVGSLHNLRQGTDEGLTALI